MAAANESCPVDTTTALARHLGLSRWTVSRALNGHPEVKASTSRRIFEAMSELGFAPNPLARGLRGGKTGIVGVCFQSFGAPIIARKIEVLQQMLHARQCRALMELSDGRADLELAIVQHFLSMRVDGILLYGGAAPERLDELMVLLARHNTPCVVIDPMMPTPLPTVELDRAGGLATMMQHFVVAGHREIAVLGISANVPYGAARMEGIRRGQQGLTLHYYAMDGEGAPHRMDFEYGRLLAEAFLKETHLSTALLCLNDQIAIGAIGRIQEAGLKVPDHFSVAGFDNIEVSAHSSPRLTTMDQQVEKMMQESVDLLFSGVSSKDKVVRRIEPVLVTRASTAPARPVWARIPY